jgi:hypothetical protein
MFCNAGVAAPTFYWAGPGLSKFSILNSKKAHQKTSQKTGKKQAKKTGTRRCPS